jgi:HAMP domain-containing protein
MRLSEPERVRFTEVRATLIRLVLSVIGAVVVLVVLAYIAARWLVAPLRTLETIMHAYAGGNY